MERRSSTSSGSGESDNGVVEDGHNFDIEKSGDLCSTKHSDGTPNNESIQYEYLTFHTVLPEYALSSNNPDLPPPNLKPFDSPFHWPNLHKTICLLISCCATFLSAYSAGAYSIAANPLRAKWHLGEVVFNTGITTWALGFASSPMVLAPFSEIIGRRPVFIGSGILFLAALVGCGGTDYFAGMLVARFFVGAGASTFAVMVGGVVSDIYHAEKRNAPMAIYSGAALAGTGAGLLVPAFIVSRANWRWCFYSEAIALGFVMVIIVFFFKETRGSVLLSRRATKLNAYFEKLENSTTPPIIKLRYKVASDEQRSSVRHMLYLSVTTPFKLLFTEPVVFFFTLWVAFAWAVLYITFDAIPLIFSTRHNFNTEQCGAVFASIVIGSIIATILSIYQEKLARKYWPKLSNTPEGRLYFTCCESSLLPVGMFWFGWTSFSDVSWVSPVIAIGVAQIGIFSIYLAVFNYFADVYHRYASSALAGQGFVRNIMAAIFPLFTNILFRNLGYPAAASLLGGVSALLTIVPWVLLFNGEKIRARSRIASEIMSHRG